MLGSARAQNPQARAGSAGGECELLACLKFADDQNRRKHLGIPVLAVKCLMG